ncbi:hypothetical protein K466DRAFT_483188 [Polyporus arcularius HHB13444]|uniref:Hypervirulence associated protein TUDOR domain-containing protein n=1 Tax=Polyporus arcularius HHB13444 TaxID=1314778 RepID=A0A5C3PPG8_9APHY|nr:hypothetical protein K466DRAFT_483188 [Polyporus arcularius HHB13444]
MDPFPVGTRVFFLEGGKTRTGTVQNTETIEGLRYVVIKLDDGSPNPVKLPCVSLSCAPIGEAHYV